MAYATYGSDLEAKLREFSREDCDGRVLVEHTPGGCVVSAEDQGDVDLIIYRFGKPLNGWAD